MKRSIAFILLFSLIMSCVMDEVPYVKASEEFEFLYTTDDTGITITGLSETYFNKEVVIPDTIDDLPVVAISDEAFAESYITGISIPNSVQKIGKRVFYNSKNLKNVSLPENLTVLPEQMFRDCKALKSIKLPNSLKKIETGAFFYSALADISIPSTVQEIDESAFAFCPIRKIEIPDSITSIKASTFSSCSYLEEVIIPDSVTEIHSGAFYGCGLKKLTLPCSVNTYCYEEKDNFDNYSRTDAFECNNITELHLTKGTGVMAKYDPDYNHAIIKNGENINDRFAPWFYSAKNLKKVIIDEGIENISAKSFRNCEALETVELPATIKKIESTAFTYCSKLGELYLPDGLETIDGAGSNGNESVFMGCKNLVIYANKDTVGYDYTKKYGYNVKSTSSMFFENEEMDINIKDTHKLNITVKMLNGKIDENPNVIWKSDDENVLTVENGIVRALNIGTAMVTAMCDDQICECTINVKSKMESIRILPGCEIIDLDKKKKAEIEILPESTTDSKDVEWESDNPLVAAVDSDGVITGMSPGTATITVKAPNGLYDSKKIKVVVPIESLQLDKSNMEMKKLTTYKLHANITPIDSNEDIEWTTSDDSVVTVNREGDVKAVGEGEAVITARTSHGISTNCYIKVLYNEDAVDDVNSISDLSKYASSGQKIKCRLCKDIEITDTKGIKIEDGTNLSIDLNGYKISGSGTIINNNGELLITDNSDSKEGKIESILNGESLYAPVYTVINKGKICLRNGSIITNITSSSEFVDSPWGVGIQNGDYLNIEGGNVIVQTTLNTKGTQATNLNQAFGVLNTPDSKGMIMSSGNISVTAKDISGPSNSNCNNYAYGIYHNTTYDLVINGGTISCMGINDSKINESNSICMGIRNNSSGMVKMQGGTVSTDISGEASNVGGGTDGIYNESGSVIFVGGNISVTTDYYMACVGIYNNKGDVQIGDLNKADSKPEIYTSQNQHVDTGLNTSSANIKIVKCNIESSVPIHAEDNINILVGENNGKVDNDDIYLLAREFLIVTNGKIFLYDGTYDGRLATSLNDMAKIQILKGYTLGNMYTDNNNYMVGNGTIEPVMYSIMYKDMENATNAEENPSHYNIESRDILLGTPKKEGYTFKGWYIDSAYTSKIAAIESGSTGDLVIYAYWEKTLFPSKNNTEKLPYAYGEKSSSSNTNKTEKLSKVKKLKAKNKKKCTVILSWKKVNNAQNYQIQYSTNKKFKNKKSKITTKKKISIKKLKKGKKYYFRIRACANNKKGSWSAVKIIKVKK